MAASIDFSRHVMGTCSSPVPNPPTPSSELCTDCKLPLRKHPYCSQTGQKHVIPEATAAPAPALKTRLCRHFEKGFCRYGAECGFAHGASELRQRKHADELDENPDLSISCSQSTGSVDNSSECLTTVSKSTSEPRRVPDLGLKTRMLKTTICRHFTNGHCKYGSECGFAHGEHELREMSDRQPSPTQQFDDEEVNIDEAPVLPSAPEVDRPELRKTRLCRHFQRGYCIYGENCAFAHGKDELRDAPKEDVPPSRVMVAIAKGPDGKIGVTFEKNVIMRINANSPLFGAVRVGMRLVNVNGRKVSTLEEIKEALEAAQVAFTAVFVDNDDDNDSDSVSDESSNSSEEVAEQKQQEQDPQQQLLQMQQAFLMYQQMMQQISSMQTA